MEPPKGFCASFWRFLYFLPFFIGLLLLGIIKGIIFCPLICLIMTIGNSAVILGLWPAHAIWTYYCIARAKRLGPVLKVALCICISILLVLWPLVGIIGSILIGAGYGLLAPLVATFEAVGEGKTDEFIHCILDGTWSTIKGSFTVVRDFTDVCFHSYFSVMDDLRLQEPPNGKKPHEIRLLRLPGAFLVGLLGIFADLSVIMLVALYKSPCMLFKGWHRLLQDLIGREGPFLETACVPFAGLAILLWPLVVSGAVLAAIISSFFLGAYAAVVAYQESSICMGLSYIISSFAIFDEYSNDVLDLQEGSCFPRLQYRKKTRPSPSNSFSRPNSFNREKPAGKNPPSRSLSLKDSIIELKPLELLEHLFSECKHHGENLVADGLITAKDIEECKGSKGSGQVVGIGLPAYCILQALLRSAKANSDGLLLVDNTTEITTMNRPKSTIFDWFFEPLMIIKQQIKAKNLSEAEENYLCKMVLLSSDPDRMKTSNIGSPPQAEQRRAEVDAFARRLQGITKSISRYPTVRRRFMSLTNSLSEELAKKNDGSGSISESRSTSRSRNGLGRIFSQKSFGNRTNMQGTTTDQEAELMT